MRIIAYILFLFVSFVPMIEIVSTGQSVDNKGTSASKYPFSDVEVHKIAGYDIGKLTGKSWDKQPWLYVVPDKKPLPIKDLFVKIKLNPSRLCSPEIYEFNFTTFHVWKLSPSYELW